MGEQRRPAHWRDCLVCGARTENTHLGVDACRACAAFYKRAVATRREYICRQGKRQCAITQAGDKFLCRRCRFDRCVKLRMRVDGGLPMDSPGGNSPTPPVEETYLGRIGRMYRSSCELRRQQEVALRMASLHPKIIVKSDDKDQPIYLSTFKFDVDAVSISAANIIQLIGEMFPEFLQLPVAEQQQIFKESIGKIYLAECYYFTEKYWPSEDRYFLWGLTSAFDTHNLDTWVMDHKEERPGQNKSVVENVTFFWKKNMKLVLPAFRKVQITETEYHALWCILIWSFDSSPMADNSIVDIGGEVKREIFADLRRYYKEELQCEDYAKRLGELMSLVHTIQESASMMQNEYQTYRLLDMLKDDCYFTKLFAWR